MSDTFELADKAIAQAYPDCNNLGKGWWGAQRIPNYGILRGAIVTTINAAVKEEIDRYRIKALDAEIKVCKAGEQSQAEKIERLRTVLMKVRACNHPPLDETQRTCFDLCQAALKRRDELS